MPLCKYLSVLLNHQPAVHIFTPFSKNLNFKLSLEEAMSSSEEIIENAGKEPGLEIWRIEDMELAVVPKNTYGTFYRHGFIL